MQAHQPTPLVDIHQQTVVDTKFPAQGNVIDPLNVAIRIKRLDVIKSLNGTPNAELGTQVIETHRLVNEAAFGGNVKYFL